MLRVGIIGMGFMGSMHWRCWQSIPEARVAAICDIEPGRLANQGGVAGNIAGAERPSDFSEAASFTSAAEMFANVELDAVSITLPTGLHAGHTLMALAAGAHVLCEKPMALTLEEGRQMIAAAGQAGKILQIGHCIRFWPQYARAREILDSGEYGAVLAASFQRLSLTPGWSWQGWILDGAQSGGAIQDMHIHDADFVEYLFGVPQGVLCRGAKGPGGGYDHVAATYLYPDGKVVTAEGGWLMAPGFGFRMSFHIVLEKATLVFDSTRSPDFSVCPVGGEPFSPVVEPGDGYSREIRHFADLVLGRSVPTVLTPEQSLASLRLVLAERESAESGMVVKI